MWHEEAAWESDSRRRLGPPALSLTFCIAILLVCLTTGHFLKNYRRELKLGKWEIFRGGGHAL